MNARAFIRERKGFFIACAMYIVFYMSHGAYYPYIALYYNSVGLSVGQIGIISAIGPCCALLVQTLWGRLADRTNRRYVWMLTLVLSGLVILLFFLNQSFGFILFVAALYVVVSTSSVPLMDTIALDYCNETGFRFSPIRLCGTLGFGVMPLIVGSIMQQNIKNIFPLYCALCFAAAAICLFMPGKSRPRQFAAPTAKKGSDFEQMKTIIKDPVVGFILCANFIVATCMSMVTFLPVYASSMGISTEYTGFLNTIGAAGEIVLLAVIDFVLKKVRTEKIMLATLLFGSLRMFIAYAAGFAQGAQGGFLMLTLSQCFHSVSYITLYYCSAQTIHRRVPDTFKATAQTMVAMVSMGLSRVVGSLLAGGLGDAVGLQQVYLFFGLFCLAGFLPVFWFYKKAKRETALQDGGSAA